MVDYSNWKKIELSSDEDEVHPFIENTTLFRLKHEARLKKMEERKKEEFAYECRKASWAKRYKEVEISIAEQKEKGQDFTALLRELAELEVEKVELKIQGDKLKKQEVAWYIDTICQPGFSKTLINTCIHEISECSNQYETFVKQNKSYLKHFASLNSFEETKNFLTLHQQIINRQTLYFLISYGIKLFLKEEKQRLKTICRQIVLLLHILELFRLSGKNSRELLLSFFISVNVADEHCQSDFEAESVKVKKLIKTFVIDELNVENIKDKADSASNENGNDPEEVFGSLPSEMQHCFVQRNKAKLAEVLARMSAEEAEYHMKRCIDSGLWIPENK